LTEWREMKATFRHLAPAVVAGASAGDGHLFGESDHWREFKTLRLKSKRFQMAEGIGDRLPPEMPGPI
jgi:hypothetical protein